VLAGSAWPVHAQATPPDSAQVEARMQEAKARLNLTPDQEAQLKPVMQERAQKMKGIRDKYAGDSSRKAKRAMFKEARPVQEDYERKVRAILTDSQEAEWKKMREEARQQMKERHRSGAAPD
jgi:class 3 adenylate cyclase